MLHTPLLIHRLVLLEEWDKEVKQDKNIATGAGHHSIIKGLDKDEWYIVYHRHPLGDTDGNHRVTCIDRMYFSQDGSILPVEMTNTGVKPLH